MTDAMETTLAEVVLGQPHEHQMLPQCPNSRIEAPFTAVIFGATGDLTARMLVPALASLCAGNHLPERFAIVGAGRTPFSDEAFHEHLGQEAARLGGISPQAWQALVPHLTYYQMDYDDPSSFPALAVFLARLDADRQLGGNRLYYLAVPPTAYEPIALGLAGAGLAAQNGGYARLVVEKPFGRDLGTAQALESALRASFTEDQIFRIDHYLAKETVQNILMLRFANAIFEPLWNRRYIDHVSILAAESLGVEHRAAYYDHFGVLRDMFQNHMLQLLSLCAMEPPSRFEADLVRDEKSKVFQALRPIDATTLNERLILGQYGPGSIEGAPVPGYHQEPRVAPDSTTPTFAAMRVHVDNWRWQGVPFTLISGKRLAEKRTEIAIHFKPVPYSMFRGSVGDAIDPNRLILRIQPDEAVCLTFQAKAPGTMCLRTVTMNFNYVEASRRPALTAYAKVLLDCLVGDQTLFWRHDGIELSWKFLRPMLEEALPLFPYPAGTFGPAEAAGLLADHGLVP